MPIITVTHTVRTYFEVPEGFTIEQLRREVYDKHDDEAEDTLRESHKVALSRAYNGKKVDEVGTSSEFKVSEGYDRS